MKRLETVQKLNEAGVPAGIFMAPILPYLTDGIEDLTALIQQAALHQTKFVMPSYLRLSTRAVKVWFFQTLQEHYPHLVQLYADLYQQSAYASPDYRKPIQQQIHTIMEQYKINSKEPAPLYRSSDAIPPEADTPVQLSFSF